MKTKRRVLLAIGLLVGAYGVLNIVLAMLPTPLAGIDDLVPRFALEGSRFLLLTLGVVLVGTSRSLMHGKRVGWLIAVAATVASLAAHPLKDLDFAGIVGSALALCGLLLTGHLFTARSDPPTAARGLVIVTLGFLAAFIYGISALYFLDNDFARPVPLAEAATQTLRLMFILPSTSIEPTNHDGEWILDSVRLFFLIVVAYSLTRLLHPVIHRHTTRADETEHVRRILAEHGRTSLAFFALLPDKSYFFSRPGNSFLAYKVVGNTAVVMGDPIGDESEFPALLAAFADQCALDDWRFCFHQATPGYLPLYQAAGLKALDIGEEAVIDLASFHLCGQEGKHLRNTVNRLSREGMYVRLIETPVPLDVLMELRDVSDDWLKEPGRRERTFTLGRFDNAYIRQTPVMAACEASGRIVAFANIIPSYKLNQGNFDLMRHRRDAPRNTIDFLFVHLARHFQAAGHSGMTLGMAPLSGAGTESRAPAAQAMRLLYEWGSVFFRYKGLRQFKEKFHPEWESRYLVYSSDLQLPALVLAIARAGELKHERNSTRYGIPRARLAPA